jgi:hypothetical protein
VCGWRKRAPSSTGRLDLPAGDGAPTKDEKDDF